MSMLDDEPVDEKAKLPQESWSSSGIFHLSETETLTREIHTAASKSPNETLAWWKMAITDSGNPQFKGVTLWPTVLDPDGIFASKVHQSVASLLSELPSGSIQRYMEGLHRITDLS